MSPSPSTCDLRLGMLCFMSLKRGIGPRSTSLPMSLGLCLRASDCENAWQVGLARRAENAGCLFTPPLLNRSAIGWAQHVLVPRIHKRAPDFRVPTTTSHSGLEKSCSTALSAALPLGRGILWRGFNRCRGSPEGIECASGASSGAFCFPRLTCEKRSYSAAAGCGPQCE
jgi:hypothetical protein